MLPVFTAFLALSGVGDARSQARSGTERMDQAFYRNGRYLAWVDESGKEATEPAFAWDMAVTLSAYAAACRVDPKRYAPAFAKTFAALEAYGGPALAGYAYSVWPGLERPDRFYDDNEWILIALCEAYETTHERRYLDRATAIFRWLVSAESPDLGGGLFWKENERREKNTCSNAPAIVGALMLHRLTGRRDYLDFALRITQWTQRFQDSDGLYFDNQKLDGTLDRTKWTYNSALMIRANLLLASITHDGKYRTEAERIGEAAVAHWVDPKSGALRDEASFAHHMADAWLELARVDPKGQWRRVAERAIEYARKQSGGPDGLYGLRWDRYEVREGRRILLYQASLVRALWSRLTP